jgi:pimeloyl-ACP methyl ester carboxylesterase
VLMQVSFVLMTLLLILPYVLISLREQSDVTQLLTPATRLMPYRGHEIAVREYGNGEVVVLLHGFAGWSDTWEELVTRLVTRNKRVITIDMLGAGASSRSTDPADYSTDAQARMALTLLQQLGVDHATLIGHSYGGRVALQMALLDSMRITKVIALAPEAYATDRPPMAKLVLVPVIGYALAFWSTAPQLIGVGLRSVSKRKTWVTSTEIQRYAAPIHVKGHLQAQITQSAAPKDGDMPVPRHLSRITCPVYLIWGDGDPVFPATDGLKLVDDLPDAHLAIVPNCGHVPHVEAADETWQFVDQALA